MDKNRHIRKNNYSIDEFEHLSTNEKIDLLVQGYRVPERNTKAKELELILSEIENKTAKSSSRKLRISIAAAASIALIALLSTVYFNFLPNKIYAERGQHAEYTLPDGSVVNLNSDSKITYSESSFKTKRLLKLNGEAFFSVQKGIPFEIKTKLGIVQVLGTTLNVFARNNEFHVSCLTGKVQVSSSGQTVIILPGEKVELISGTLKKTTNLESSQMALWRTGEFHFEYVPLISIFDEIARQFNVEITATDVENRFFTGTFSNKNLTEVLETVCLPMSLEYDIKSENKIRVRAKKK